MPVGLDFYSFIQPIFFTNNYMKVNKQLNDKERVAAALENPVLLETVEQCLANTDVPG